MLDIEKAYKEFDEYAKKFNPNEGRVKLKIGHIKRVANTSKLVAIKLGLSTEKVKLAEIIGLFHDIGRFKQIEMYHTFSDKDSFNHAELSVKTLFEDNLIEKFNIDEKYYKIIKIAILNHNKDKIDNNLDGEELLFAKIIRDADKLDIYYTIGNYDFIDIFWYSDFSCKKINDIIIKQFKEEHYIDYHTIKNNADLITAFYAYIFDINFKSSLEYLKSKKYLEKFTQKVKENFKSILIHKQVDELLEICNTYLNNEIKRG